MYSAAALTNHDDSVVLLVGVGATFPVRPTDIILLPTLALGNVNPSHQSKSTGAAGKVKVSCTVPLSPHWVYPQAQVERRRLPEIQEIQEIQEQITPDSEACPT